jgi:hypothetical protein
LLGVFLTRRKRFQSRISINGKPAYLGTFATAIEAHAVYMSAFMGWEYLEYLRHAP